MDGIGTFMIGNYGKIMNKKILIGSIISVVILVGVSLTSVVGMSTELEKETSTDVFSSYRGLALNLPKTEDGTYFVIWLLLNENQDDTELLLLKWVTFTYGLDIYREFIIGIGIFMYISGFYKGIE